MYNWCRELSAYSTKWAIGGPGEGMEDNKGWFGPETSTWLESEKFAGRDAAPSRCCYVGKHRTTSPRPFIISVQHSPSGDLEPFGW